MKLKMLYAVITSLNFSVKRAQNPYRRVQINC